MPDMAGAHGALIVNVTSDRLRDAGAHGNLTTDIGIGVSGGARGFLTVNVGFRVPLKPKSLPGLFGPQGNRRPL